MINDNQVYESIRKSIQMLREKHPETGQRTTQQALADAVGIKRATLTNIELGNQRAPVNIIYRVCEYFSVPLEKIMPEVSSVKEKMGRSQTDVDEIKRTLPQGILSVIEKASS